MKENIKYFIAANLKGDRIIYIVAETEDIATEISQYYYKCDFKLGEVMYCDLPVYVVDAFDSANIRQGYWVYDKVFEAIAYVSRKDILDDILTDL